MAVLKQRKIDGERRVFQDKWTDQYFFIAHKRNSCGFNLFGNIIEYSFRPGSSREGHEVSNSTLNPNQSLMNATAYQLDIIQFAANPNWLRIGPTAAVEMFLLRHRLWMPICLKIILFFLHCSEKPTFLLLLHLHTCVTLSGPRLHLRVAIWPVTWKKLHLPVLDCTL